VIACDTSTALVAELPMTPCKDRYISTSRPDQSIHMEQSSHGKKSHCETHWLFCAQKTVQQGITE
jgi:hypothetical protein